MNARGVLIGVLVALASSAAASAQVRVGPFPPGQGRGAGGRATPVPPEQLGMIGIEPVETARPVTGAPYMADSVTETTQVLADGNRIERRTTASIARDSKGRVRREQQALSFGGLVIGSPLVTIADPAARTHITLDRERRVATRVTTPLDSLARSSQVPAGPAPGGAVAQRAPADVEVKTEPIGEREIEGVRAEGARTTMTIPANAVGNRAPITTVSERWFAPALQAIVLTRRTDPRFGETVYRLVNITRAEPPRDLFEIPAEYRIDEQTVQRPSLRLAK